MKSFRIFVLGLISGISFLQSPALAGEVKSELQGKAQMTNTGGFGEGQKQGIDTGEVGSSMQVAKQVDKQVYQDSIRFPSRIYERY